MDSNKKNEYIKNNNINNVLNDSHSKIFFLKAILLGINYGHDKNSEFYKKTIENEITNYNKIITNDNNIITNDNIIKRKDIYKKDTIQSPGNEIIQYHNKLLHLNNEKKYIMSYILSLSKNYALNNSKINILKNSLLYLNKSIDKTIKLLKNYNNKRKYNKDVYNKHNQYFKNEYNKQQNIDSTLDNELEETLGNLSNLMM